MAQTPEERKAAVLARAKAYYHQVKREDPEGLRAYQRHNLKVWAARHPDRVAENNRRAYQRRKQLKTQGENHV